MLQIVAAVGALVLNEVLYDPSGADGGREFVELLNSSAERVALAELSLETGDGAHPGVWRPVWRGAAGELQPGAFLVIGGDSLGAVEHLTFDLQNGPDALRLVRATHVIDLLGYGALTDAAQSEGHPAADVSGASLARRPDGVDTNDNSHDFVASTPTPGRRNVSEHDLALSLVEPDPVLAWPGRWLTASAWLRNRGVLAVAHWTLQAQWLDPSAGTPPAFDVPTVTLLPGDSLHVPVAWLGMPGLHALEVRIVPADDDTTNDVQRTWVRVGCGDVYVNEILFAPSPSEPEWVELFNRGAQAHDVSGWTLTDQSGRAAHLAARAALAPGGFAIVSADTAAPIPRLTPGTLRIAATPWNALNNSDAADGYADRLVLRDATGVVGDALRYAAAWGQERNRSLERLVEDPDVQGLLWASCKDPQGATPGRVNSTTTPPRGALELQLAPNPFSPDGDGHDDVLGASIRVPTGYDGYRLRVFDLGGRLRATVQADRLGAGPRALLWEGRDDHGIFVETGFYIVELELNASRLPRLRERRVLGVVRR